MSEAILILCCLITLLCVACAAIVSAVGCTMVYSWWRKLQLVNAELPELIQNRINELVARQIEPYREILDEHGKATAQPVQSTASEIDLDEDYNEWMAKS